jgi:hypothetical protein
LLWFLYCYLVQFAPATANTSGSTTSAIGANVLLFSLFALHHSALARPAIKRRIQHVISPELERSLYT